MLITWFGVDGVPLRRDTVDGMTVENGRKVAAAIMAEHPKVWSIVLVPAPGRRIVINRPARIDRSPVIASQEPAPYTAADHIAYVFARAARTGSMSPQRRRKGR